MSEQSPESFVDLALNPMKTPLLNIEIASYQARTCMGYTGCNAPKETLCMVFTSPRTELLTW